MKYYAYKIEIRCTDSLDRLEVVATTTHEAIEQTVARIKLNHNIKSITILEAKILPSIYELYK